MKKSKSTEINWGILHYNGQSVKCILSDPLNRFWFSHFCKTPFYSESVLLNLLKMSQDSLIEINFLWRIITNLSSNRQRGFFIYPKDVNRIVGLIGKNDNDIGLNASFPNATDNLISVMEENRDNIIFFIYIEAKDYINLREILIQHDFEENLDFFNVSDLLPDHDGYRIVSEM